MSSGRFPTIIADRRDGRRHTQEDLEYLAKGAATGSIPDYQLSAWLMAAYLNPLDLEQTAWLTLAMADSGERMDLSGLPKPWVDKHSTGGVGDKTTLVVLPILAACELTVIKMSGRGLGITGGTVDKLASVPGFQVDLSPEQMLLQAKNIGIALTGQSPSLAPADKALYALRDVTETVSSVPLIVSSILSKKLAGGADVIVLDVKCGSGAFMKSLAEARTLAAALQDTAKLCGKRAKIVISDMSEPLGAAIGNALEVQEALDVLDPAKASALLAPGLRFRGLCLELASIALEAAGIPDARSKVLEALESGVAFGKACEWFMAQGAVSPASTEFSLPAARVKRIVFAPREGWVKGISSLSVGQAVLDLGGGRHQKADLIDPSVGVVLHACVGSQVSAELPIFEVHAATEAAAEAAEAQILSGFELSEVPIDPNRALISIL